MAKETSKGHQKIPRNDPVRLGLMPPLSGLVKLYGSEITWAAKIATDEVNERGGILGRPLELVVRDDGSMPEMAVPAAEKLIEDDGCVAIIGNLLSNSRIAVANRVADPKQVPYLNFSFYEGSISSRYFFHFAALPNQQIEKMIPFMAKSFGQKFFFAGSNYEWPRGSIDAAKRALIAHGGEVIGEKYLPIGSKNVEGLLGEVERSGADVFVPYFAGTDQINLLIRFTEMGLKERMKVVMGHYDEAMVSLLTPEVREGFYSSNTYFMSVDTPESKSYMKRLEKLPEVNGIWPNGNGVLTNFGEGAYICVHAFAKAAEMAGTVEAEALVDILETITVNGPQGKVIMDPLTHHATVNTHLSRCEADGTFTLIETFEPTAPEIPKRYRAEPDTHKKIFPETTVGQTRIFPRLVTSPPAPAPSPDVEVSQKILKAVDIAIISIEEDGKIVQVNECAANMFGYPVCEMMGLSIHLLLPPHLRKAHKTHIQKFMKSGKERVAMGSRGEILGYRKDGSEFPAEATIAKFRDGEGWKMVATLRNITDRIKREENLIWLGTHDTLTNLPNRSLMRDRIAHALARSQRTGLDVAVMFVDLDGFKLINDSYGHDIGDKLLVNIAKSLGHAVRPGDTVSRFGGDEFVILCENIKCESMVAGIAERIINIFNEPIFVDNLKLFSSGSIGVAIGKGKTHLPEDLMRNADAAMYQAKEQGRDRWQIFNTKLHETAKKQLVIANGLRTACENNELELHYQPIVDLKSDHIIAAECLLRWSPAGKPIPPDAFIPVAEKTGTISQIGEWVYRQACRALMDLGSLQTDRQVCYLSVNLSARQLSDNDLIDRFKSILQETGADPSRILLEVTETSLMTDIEANVRKLEELNALGHKLAVDDFGTGYSSLAQLVRLPLNTLKIDRMFVDALIAGRGNNPVVSAIVSLAHALGHKVIAEGVENQEQLTILSELGCESGQGYFFHRPVPYNAFRDILLGKANSSEEAVA
ncbi:MAG: EAL domain-containing protein [Rhodospirillales bacterium]|nr:EAL domain-containing protein [Rhodospirillales bacterium]